MLALEFPGSRPLVDALNAAVCHDCPSAITEQHDGKYRFEPRGTMYVGPGSAGSLIPPHEYHTIRNPSDDAIAVTVHVYRGAMTECSVFRPLDTQWYSRDQRQLSLDA